MSAFVLAVVAAGESSARRLVCTPHRSPQICRASPLELQQPTYLHPPLLCAGENRLHNDAVLDPDHFGTLVLCLGEPFAGGQLALRHDGEMRIIDWSEHGPPPLAAADKGEGARVGFFEGGGELVSAFCLRHTFQPLLARGRLLAPALE